jgi:hypothetical protein
MNRSNLPWFLVIALTIAVILLILFQPKPEPSHYIKENESLIAQKTEKIEVLTKEYEKIASQIHTDSVRQAKKDSVYSFEIKKRDRRISDLKRNPVIVRVREQTPEVDSLIHAYDSAFMQMSAQIFSLQTTLRQVYTNEAMLEHNFNERLELERSKFEDQKAITNQYEKDLRKAKRGNRLLKVAAVLGTGLGLVLGAGTL